MAFDESVDTGEQLHLDVYSTKVGNHVKGDWPQDEAYTRALRLLRQPPTERHPLGYYKIEILCEGMLEATLKRNTETNGITVRTAKLEDKPGIIRLVERLFKGLPEVQEEEVVVQPTLDTNTPIREALEKVGVTDKTHKIIMSDLTPQGNPNIEMAEGNDTIKFDYSKSTRDDLRATAMNRGIKGYSKMTKAQLIEALEQ